MATLLRIKLSKHNIKGFWLIHFTDNQATYDIRRKSYSTKPHMMSLVCDICLPELELGCKIIVIHVPWKILIAQGTDALSRGVLLYPIGGKDGISPIIFLFRPALPSLPLLKACFSLGEIPKLQWNLKWGYQMDLSSWNKGDLMHKNTLWYLSPTIAKQGFLYALQCWYKSPWDSSHLFIVPRIMLREFGRVSKSVQYLGKPWDMHVGFDVVVPFVLFYLPPFNRTRTVHLHKLRIATNAPPTPRIPQSIERELLAMHRISQG